MPADESVAAPEVLRAAYTSWRWTAVSAYPRQMTWRLDRDTATRYLKVGVASEYPPARRGRAHPLGGPLPTGRACHR